ncbi:GTPase Era [Bienertia sinuspersici]
MTTTIVMWNPEKNSVLAVQTIRNNLMASTLLATIAITLSSLISALVSSSNSLMYTVHTTKYLSVLICFLVAFFCNMQCTRYYAHVSFLLNVPPSCEEGRDEFIEYVAQQLNRGGLFWSLGLRAFYFSFPLLLWIFGATAMLACSLLMAVLLYFLDSASSSPIYLQSCHLNNQNSNIESAGHSM